MRGRLVRAAGGLLLMLGSAAAVAVPDTLAQRLLACSSCHGPEGRASPEGYLPRIAGKPAAYLAEQLEHFHSGRRQHRAMAALLASLTPTYRAEIAAHFASLDLPYPPPLPTRASAQQLARGEQLVRSGDAARGLPACVACHGDTLTGRLPAVPGLLGLPPDYLISQLGGWREGLRRAAAPDCMATLAKRMAPEDVSAAALWLAAQPVPRPAAPAPAPPVGAKAWPLDCGASAATAAAAPSPPASPRSALVVRGEYLARVGNCLHCHTAPGGPLGGGGRAVATPFGEVFAGNLTPHATGLGGWSAEQFRRALHEGRSRDGRLLLPAFPYPEFTRLTPADGDALFAYLQTLPPVDHQAVPHRLRWPFGQAWAVAAWRALYFRPQVFRPDPARDAVWNRGAYLVQALGHCGSCHTPRNALAAAQAGRALAGAPMPGSGWLAPALDRAWSPAEAPELAALLHTGRSRRGAALGPMAEVVLHGTQHLSTADLAAMVRFLTEAGGPPRPPAQATPVPPEGRSAEPGLEARLGRGAQLYREHCADCHGRQGEGAGPYLALAASRTVRQADPGNLVKVIRSGGFAPATAANPRPYGMPPFGHVLSDAEIAAVASFVRSRWAAAAGPVSELQVMKVR